jgi:phage protein U
MFYALGLFAFDTSTLLFSDLDRNRRWRHPRTEVFGALPTSQFVGPGEDTVTLTGIAIPEICGKYSFITTLAAMADQGDAYPLVRGDGMVLGHFTIERLAERHSNMIDTGQARSVEFTIDLSRVPDA